MPSSRFRDLGFRVAYDGKNFFGFQAQANQPTVQSALEEAFKIYFKKRIVLDFTSRTDSGVHAYDQWVILRNGLTFYAKLSADQKKRFVYSLNALLPSTVRIHQAVAVSSDFHPKKSPKAKEYSYLVYRGVILDPFYVDKVWWVRSPLNIAQIKKGLKRFEGTHDFSAFSKQSGQKRNEKKSNCVRTILKTRFIRKKHPVFEGCELLEFRFLGKGFLHHMVRNMVGTLIEQSQLLTKTQSKLKTYTISEILKSKDRKYAGRTAPAAALTLISTIVEKKFFRPL